MDLNGASLTALNLAFTTAFNTTLFGAATTYNRIAMTVNSTTRTQSYPKLSSWAPASTTIFSRRIARLRTPSTAW